ncbi:hypothetical protein [Ovoidimarina sediminis]|uniref:hypothetical protein n=1 Tax=Ovoidimarina sediminis TaxID=3079856 RepID=UPI00292E9605|nr:hypothetical protein [Rhodophyticola sp. MJ-SS7]
MPLRLAAIAALLALAGCAEQSWAPEAEIQQAIRPYEGPTKLTLFTVQSTRSGQGAHSALMVSGAHRALFDPAGTFRMPGAPERNDVIYGVTDRVLSVYIDYHARETYDVRIQEVAVSRDTAALALQLIQDHGAVPKAHCNIAVTRILSQLPGFAEVPRGYYPNRTADWMARRPGVSGRLVTDDDADDNHGVLIAAAAASPG